MKLSPIFIEMGKTILFNKILELLKDGNKQEKKIKVKDGNKTKTETKIVPVVDMQEIDYKILAEHICNNLLK